MSKLCLFFSSHSLLNIFSISIEGNKDSSYNYQQLHKQITDLLRSIIYSKELGSVF